MEDFILNRKSSRNFDANREIPIEVLDSVIEATRWAPSSSNYQPWKFIVFDNRVPEQKNALVQTLAPGNQQWAVNAPILILTTAMTRLDDGRDYWVGLHDLGLANENMMLQAQLHGLTTRAIGGFNKKLAQETFNIPENYQPVAVIALGYPGKLAELPEAIQAKEQSQRQRKPREEVFSLGSFHQKLPNQELVAQ